MINDREIVKEVSKTVTHFYNNPWFDTSGISIFDFAETFENYQVERESIFLNSDTYDNHRLNIKYVMARPVYTEEWAIESIDIVLGIVGGFFGLVWSLLAFLLGGYEAFRSEHTLIGDLYKTDS